MPISRVIAGDVGPFEHLDLDLSDGKGNAHLGPHVLCGVNGCGKSTVLRTIAWCVDQNKRGFDNDDWFRFLKGRRQPRAVVEIGSEPQYCSVAPEAVGHPVHLAELKRWIGSYYPDHPADASGLSHPAHGLSVLNSLKPQPVAGLGCIAAYEPRLILKHLAQPPSAATINSLKSALAFGKTVSNEDVQGWWVNAFSVDQFVKAGRSDWAALSARTTQSLKDAVVQILGAGVEADVDVEPETGRLQPRVRFRGNSLNFSQLPAGFNSTIAWVADYLMRQSAHRWLEGQEAERPGLILIDEIETHLHPRWQRGILPALRAAFPYTQMIVTSHSPFVISSCRGARIHVLELDAGGKATARPPMDAPIGRSLAANIHDVFGVASDYDLETERELNEWNRLKRKQDAGALPPEEEEKLNRLTEDLASRSHELRLLVSPTSLSPSLISELLEAARK